MFDQSTHVFVSYQCNGFIFVLLDRPPIWKKAPSGVFVGIYVLGLYVVVDVGVRCFLCFEGWESFVWLGWCLLVRVL